MVETTLEDGPPPHKRRRGYGAMDDDGGDDIGDTSGAMIEYTDEFNKPATSSGSIRTSSLSSPTLKLTGHTGSVYAVQYDPSGNTLCSAGFDMTALLWNHQDDYANFNILKGHKNAILDVKWTCKGDEVLTASADKTLGYYDAATGNRIRKLQGHEGIVNAVDTSRVNPHLLVSASDDRTCALWDLRQKSRHHLVQTLSHDYQVTAVAYDDTHSAIYTGGIDNLVVAWDIRQTAQKQFAMKGHSDTITYLSLHPQSTHVLSHSMDGTLRSWDIRPFVANKNQRFDKQFVGATTNAEKGLLKCGWSSDGMMVTAGSADAQVHIWDVPSTEELYLLPGHSGCVNATTFHPHENIICSAASDKTIYVGELG